MIYLRFLLFSNQTSFQSSTKMLITKSQMKNNHIKILLDLNVFTVFAFPNFPVEVYKSSNNLEVTNFLGVFQLACHLSQFGCSRNASTLDTSFIFTNSPLMCV